MKILAVCSVINFRDFTRRATIEAIKKEVNTLDVLLYISLKNKYKKKITVDGIQFFTYHFWVPDFFKKIWILGYSEHTLRGRYWRKKLAYYDWIFFTDPNQAWLLPYIKQSKIVYLIRDPNVLQNINNKDNERELLKNADLVLATSKNLTDNYLAQYHGIIHNNIHYWPNCVDINLWKAERSELLRPERFKVGIAGNFGTNRTDYALLDCITDKCYDIDFEIAGNLGFEQAQSFWNKLFTRTNVKYLGIVPFDKLPDTVVKWNVGLIADKMDEYSSFMHHNKVYQYLALGLPVVSLRINEDYSSLYPYVHLADDHEDYINAIYVALKQSKDDLFRQKCIILAGENSSEMRAREFVSMIKSS